MPPAGASHLGGWLRDRVDPWALAAGELALALALALAWLARSARALARDPVARAEDALVFGGTILAAVVLTEPGLANWDVDFLPAVGRGVGTAERLEAARLLLPGGQLLSQLFSGTGFAGPPGAAPPPSWFPTPAALLVAPGAIVLAVFRPVLAVQALATIALPQIALSRFLNGEGLVGCRYFLPALPHLALLAAAPVGAALEWAERRAPLPRGAALLAGGALVALGVLAVWPLYRARYTFQAEHRFLADALPAGPCRVFHVAVHDDPARRNDADCCLDPGRSPLTLRRPDVTFKALAIDDQGGLPRGLGCRLYYESPICRYGPTPESERRNPGLAARLRARCARLLEGAALTPVAEARLPARATWPFFTEDEVTVRLLRVTGP